jgi:hypothetical protein
VFDANRAIALEVSLRARWGEWTWHGRSVTDG